LEYIINKYELDVSGKNPIDINISRWKEFPKLLSELGYKNGVEVGVWKGHYTKVLCEAGMSMCGIDIWEGYEGYKDFEQHGLEEAEKSAKNRLKDYDCTLVKGWSMDVVKKIKDDSLDFVFIDGNHDFRHVTEDIDEWKKKVRPGGIVAGHDFFRSRRGKNDMHVREVVPAYAYAYKINPWFVLRGDKCPSWFYIKQ
jgi:SAM-dependent methyltransferase